MRGGYYHGVLAPLLRIYIRYCREAVYGSCSWRHWRLAVTSMINEMRRERDDDGRPPF